MPAEDRRGLGQPPMTTGEPTEAAREERRHDRVAGVAAIVFAAAFFGIPAVSNQSRWAEEERAIVAATTSAHLAAAARTEREIVRRLGAREAGGPLLWVNGVSEHEIERMPTVSSAVAVRTIAVRRAMAGDPGSAHWDLIIRLDRMPRKPTVPTERTLKRIVWYDTPDGRIGVVGVWSGQLAYPGFRWGRAARTGADAAPAPDTLALVWDARTRWRIAAGESGAAAGAAGRDGS